MAEPMTTIIVDGLTWYSEDDWKVLVAKNARLEAKLAKVVEAFGRLVYLQSGGLCTGIQSEQWLSEARTTLAELTGGKDD